MLLFKEDVAVTALSVGESNKSCCVGMILKKTKWLVNYSYNPTKNISSHLESLSPNLDLDTSKFENISVIVDLNNSMEDNKMEHFCENYNLKSLIKVPTCY